MGVMRKRNKYFVWISEKAYEIVKCISVRGFGILQRGLYSGGSKQVGILLHEDIVQIYMSTINLDDEELEESLCRTNEAKKGEWNFFSHGRYGYKKILCKVHSRYLYMWEAISDEETKTK